jgi:3-oxoacyl-[acyl-carrier protein] reductase
LDAVAEAIHETHGVEVHAQLVDVVDAAGVHNFAAAVEHLRPAHVLVNCAAALGPVGRIDKVLPDSWRETIVTNLVGTAICCAAFVPQMAAAGRGSIINFSGAGLGGEAHGGRISAYVASKGGVVALTEALAGDLQPLGIRVNAIAPGPLPTGFMDGVLQNGPDVSGTSLYEQTVAQYHSQLSPGALLDLVLFLASEDSEPISGKLLSARWDDPTWMRTHTEEVAHSSKFTLRRIDDDLFGALRHPGGRVE